MSADPDAPTTTFIAVAAALPWATRNDILAAIDAARPLIAAEARASERERIRQRAADLIDQYENDGEYREPEIRQFVADLLDGDTP